MNIIINKNLPANVLFWNRLAEENGNLLQSTYYDEVQRYYRLEPIYIEVISGSDLIGGLKLYLWKSTKLGNLTETLSKSVTQFGEIILKKNITEEIRKNVLNELQTKVMDFLINQRVVTFQSGGFYGDSTLLLNYENMNCEKSTLFNVATINLDYTVEQLWQNIHLKHKQSIKKAEKSSLQFISEDNIDMFIELMKETYKNNESSPPNFDYVRDVYKILSKNGLAELFFVKQNDQYLSGAFNNFFGKHAYYLFGGNRKNPLGAGVWLHWQIMKYFKNKGITSYCLGQVSKDNMPENVKFMQGISPFKRRFGVIEKESFSKRIILRPANRKIWKILLRVLNMN